MAILQWQRLVRVAGGNNSQSFLSAAAGKFLGQLAVNAADIIFQ